MSAFPNITPSSVTITSVNPTRITKTMNGVEHRQSTTGQYFTLSVEFTGLNKTEARQIFNHINANLGPLTTFSFTLPDYLGDTTGDQTSAVVVNGTNSPGVTTVNVTGLNQTTSFKAGDLVNFFGQKKTYVITADAGTGDTGIDISPPLRTTLTNGIAVNYDNVAMQVRYAEDQTQISIGTDEFTSFTVELIEVVE